MKHTYSFFWTLLLCIVTSFGCSDRKPSVAELIDIEAWNEETMLFLKEKIKIEDSILTYYHDDKPLVDKDDSSLINRDTVSKLTENFESRIRQFQQTREKVISILLDNDPVRNTDSFHIVEFEGSTARGFRKTFAIYIKNEMKSFYYYDANNDMYTERKINCAGDYTVDFDKDTPSFCSLMCRFTIGSIFVSTHITKTDNNKLLYKTGYVQLW